MVLRIALVTESFLPQINGVTNSVLRILEGFAPDVIHLAPPIFLGNYVTKIASRLEIPTSSVYQTDITGFARHYGLSVAHSRLKKWVARIHSQTNRTFAPAQTAQVW